MRRVNFTVNRGKTIGIIGESGSGKSVTARAITQLLAKNGKIVGGHIHFHHRLRGTDAAETTQLIDITTQDPDGRTMRELRGGEIAMIFQEPMSSLTPVYTAGVHIGEALKLHRRVDTQVADALKKGRELTDAEAREIATEMLHKVGIPQPGQRVDSYPHQCKRWAAATCDDCHCVVMQSQLVGCR